MIKKKERIIKWDKGKYKKDAKEKGKKRWKKERVWMGECKGTRVENVRGKRKRRVKRETGWK